MHFNMYRLSGLLCGLLWIFITSRLAHANTESLRIADAAYYFRSACSAELSEERFIKFLEGVSGAKKSVVAGRPFSSAFGLPGHMAATFYGQQKKCCISISGVSMEVAIEKLSRNLELRNPKPIYISGRKAVVFRPEFNNRIVSLDFATSVNTSVFMTNICHTAVTNADAAYRAIGN